MNIYLNRNDFLSILGTHSLNGCPVCTRDGRPVKILSIDENLPAPIMALVATPLEIDTSEEIKLVWKNNSGEVDDDFDLEEEIRLNRNLECIRLIEGQSLTRFFIPFAGVFGENIPMEWQPFYYFKSGRHNQFIETEHDLIPVKDFKHTN